MININDTLQLFTMWIPNVRQIVQNVHTVYTENGTVNIKKYGNILHGTLCEEHFKLKKDTLEILKRANKRKEIKR